MYAPRTRPVLPALAALAMIAGIGAVLVSGLRPHWREQVRSALVAVDLAPPRPERTPPPPPPPPPSPVSAQSAPRGDPGTRGLRGRASPVFVPPVQPPLIAPPPIVAAPLPGPGQGAGGSGEGGGGRGGAGIGAGGGAVTAPRQIRGRLSYADLPQGLITPGQQASVALRYTVLPDGRVANCRTDQSSGFPMLDATACRLITERFRFRPAKDRTGRPVAATVAEEHAWIARVQD